VSKTRLEAFSDGVFAIAVTLLILDVIESARPHEASELGRELLRAWPSYAGYAVSFVTIGIMWVNHHALFHLFDHVDRLLLFTNLLLLLCVAFVPFPTALVAEFLRGDGARAATLTYGLTMTVTALVFNALWHSGRRLLRADADPREVSGFTRSYLIGPLMYGGATLLAFASAYASAAAYAAIAGFFVLSASVWSRG
jgi:uncharacterized membrane protein